MHCLSHSTPGQCGRRAGGPWNGRGPILVWVWQATMLCSTGEVIIYLVLLRYDVWSSVFGGKRRLSLLWELLTQHNSGIEPGVDFCDGGIRCKTLKLPSGTVWGGTWGRHREFLTWPWDSGGKKHTGSNPRGKSQACVNPSRAVYLSGWGQLHGHGYCFHVSVQHYLMEQDYVTGEACWLFLRMLRDQLQSRDFRVSETWSSDLGSATRKLCVYEST